MFYVLAITLCLAVMFLVLAGATLLCMPAARWWMRMGRKASPDTAANVFFAARVLPFAVACVVSLGLALPAFLKFEPHSTEEGIGLRLTVLAFLGAAALIAMLVRGWQILRATNRLQSEWRAHSERIFPDGMRVPVYRVANEKSLLAVTGLLRPRIFVAQEIVENLSREELHAALAHEMAHVSSFDNLKQLLLKMTRPPRWLKVFQNADTEWLNASEISADQAALADGVSVLDLSSALVKVGRLSRPFSMKETLASHLVPPACGSSLELRVTRLSELLEGREEPPAHFARRHKFALPLVLALVAYVVCINASLPAIHEALEFLVR